MMRYDAVTIFKTAAVRHLEFYRSKNRFFKQHM